MRGNGRGACSQTACMDGYRARHSHSKEVCAASLTLFGIIPKHARDVLPPDWIPVAARPSPTEVGHTLNDQRLRHTPNEKNEYCAVVPSGPAPDYPPYPGLPKGSIGEWGVRITAGTPELLDPGPDVRLHGLLLTRVGIAV